MTPPPFDPDRAAKGRRVVREADVEAAFVRRVAALGGVAEKYTSPSRRAVPDRLVLMPGGWHCFVELKAPGQTPTTAQRRDHEARRAMGHRVDVIDSIEAAHAWTP